MAYINSKEFKIFWATTTTVVALLVGYYYNEWLVEGHIHWGRTLLYAFIPYFLGLFVFKLSHNELGLGWPRFDKLTKNTLLISFALILLAFSNLHYFTGYLDQYSFYRQSDVDFMDKFLRFSFFTLSTIPAWEFLHRGFLLGALRSTLNRFKELQVPVILSLVMMSESLYHLIKPDVEAFGMVLLSPFLTWITLRSRSLLPALGLHLFVEYLFFWQLTK